MQRRHQNAAGKWPPFPKTTTVETTLYDLIKAVSEEIKPEEDHLVSIIVKDLLYTNRTVSHLQ